MRDEYLTWFCIWTCYETDPLTPASPVKQTYGQWTYTWGHYPQRLLLLLSISTEPAYFFRVTPSQAGFPKRNQRLKNEAILGEISPLSPLNSEDQNFSRLCVPCVSITEDIFSILDPLYGRYGGQTFFFSSSLKTSKTCDISAIVGSTCWGKNWLINSYYVECLAPRTSWRILRGVCPRFASTVWLIHDRVHSEWRT